MQTTNIGYATNSVGASALSAIALLDPATVDQLVQYLTVLGLHVSSPQITAAIAILGLVVNQVLLHRAHNETPTPSVDALMTGKQAGFATLLFRWYLAACMVVFLVTAGCASFQKNAPVAQLGVEAATMKVIEAKPASGFPIGATAAQRAAKIREIATAAKSFFDTGTADLAQLQAEIEKRVAPLNLAPSDRLLADALIQTVMSELQMKVGTGVLSPDQVYQVSAVLGWVITATNYYQ